MFHNRKFRHNFIASRWFILRRIGTLLTRFQRSGFSGDFRAVFVMWSMCKPKDMINNFHFIVDIELFFWQILSFKWRQRQNAENHIFILSQYYKAIKEDGKFSYLYNKIAVNKCSLNTTIVAGFDFLWVKPIRSYGERRNQPYPRKNGLKYPRTG